MPSEPTRLLSQWLTEQVQKLPAGTPLPTTEALATRFGISPRTVNRALAGFIRTRKIVRVRGRGSFVGGPDDLPRSPTRVARRDPVQTVVDAVSDEIATGAFRVGDPLPALKYLRVRFSVAPDTVSEAYRRLVKKGLVVQIGRTFWVGGRLIELLNASSRVEVYLLNPFGEDCANIFQGDDLAIAYRRMEQELMSKRVLLRYESAHTTERLARAWRKKGPPLGVVLFKTTPEFALEHLRPLRSFMKASSALKVLADISSGNPGVLAHDALVLSRGNILTSCARTLSRFLVQSHYRNALFCFDNTRFMWGHYGIPRAIARVRAELRRLNSSFHYKFVISDTQPESAADRFFGDDDFKRGLTQSLSKYEHTTWSELSAETIFSATPPEQLVQLYPEADIWVCSTAALAVEIVRCLRALKRRIARDVSVVSLEDNPHYYHMGLSCCAPDYDRIGYLAAHAALGDIPVARTRQGFIRTEACVVERLTTRI